MENYRIEKIVENIITTISEYDKLPLCITIYSTELLYEKGNLSIQEGDYLNAELCFLEAYRKEGNIKAIYGYTIMLFNMYKEGKIKKKRKQEIYEKFIIHNMLKLTIINNYPAAMYKLYEIMDSENIKMINFQNIKITKEELFRKSVEKKYVPAMLEYAMNLEDKSGKIELFKQIIDTSDIYNEFNIYITDAIKLLANILIENKEFLERDAQMIKYLMAAANNGHYIAILECGYTFMNGKYGYEKQWDLAEFYFSEFINKYNYEYSDFSYDYAIMLLNGGNKLEKNVDKAIDILIKCKNNNNQNAINKLNELRQDSSINEKILKLENCSFRNKNKELNDSISRFEESDNDISLFDLL